MNLPAFQVVDMRGLDAIFWDHILRSPDKRFQLGSRVLSWENGYVIRIARLGYVMSPGECI